MKKKNIRKVICAGLSVLTAVGTFTGCSAKTAAVSYETQAAAAASADKAAAAYDTAASQQRLGLTDPDSMLFIDGGSPEMSAAKAAAGSSFNSYYRESYGGEYMNSEEYTHLTENGYRSVAEYPLSTFSADVDTASYANVRRMLEEYGEVYDPDAVRIEELINYFDYDYELPGRNEAFGVTTQYTRCPWNEDAELLLIGVKTPEIDFKDRPDNNLVFLIDVSGSMYSDDKLPLLQKSFAMLAENLTERDRVSIVTYAGYETVVLEGEPGNHTAKIIAALEDLEADGSTAGEAGIKRAYAIAEENFIEGGNNRIILATDGDLNVGASSVDELNRLVSKKRKSGVFLSVLGVGTGNLKDSKMETLADNGNGNYSYLDSIFEAKKVLVDEMGGTLVTVAKDVKFQVEFNPEHVKGYRLVGYENRLLADEDFEDDTVDAGEIGAGHTVTVLYEILTDDVETGSKTGLKYQKSEKESEVRKSITGDELSSELLTVSIRYKEPDGEKSRLCEYPVKAAEYTSKIPAEAAWASAVAEFGMLLKDSEFSGNASKEDVLALAEAGMKGQSDGYRKEFYQMAERYLK